MAGDLYIAMGDITRLHADAICLSRGHGVFGHKSPHFVRLARHAKDHGRGRDLAADYTAALAARKVRPENPIHWDKDPNRAFYLPCGEERPPYGVAWTIVFPRGTEAPGEEPSALAAVDAIRAAVEGLRARSASAAIPPKRYLVALVGFGLGKGGARFKQIQVARAQIGVAFDALAAYPDELDLAFVLQDPVSYGIYLDARREVRAARGMAPPDPLPVSAPPLIEALRGEECVLFVGSGLSRNSEVTDYDALIRRMAEELGVSEPERGDIETYLDVAQRFRDVKGDTAVRGLIQKLYAPAADPNAAPGALPSLAHYLLLGLPARFVITTNYDRLLEDTLEALGRHPLRVIDARDVPRTGDRDGVCVVKMHGDAVANPESVVLGREDYDAFFERRPEMAALLEGLLLNQTFFFVGYALRDPNFRQVFSRIDRVLRRGKRPAFATEFAELSEHVRYRYERDQLRLIDFSAAPSGGATRAFLRFLDTLSEAVLAGGERTFLAPDEGNPAAEAGHPLHDLNESLRNVGDELLRAISAVEEAGAPAPTMSGVRTLARTLALLCDLGWAPRATLREELFTAAQTGNKGPGDVPNKGQEALSHLWRALADAGAAAGLPISERRRLLVRALRHAKSPRLAARLRAAIAALDAKAGKS